MGEQYRSGREPMLIEDLAEPTHGPLARIDHDGIRTGTRGQDVAVALQHPRGKPRQQHGTQFPILG